MLVAVSGTGRRMTASVQSREAAVHCPSCGSQLVVRIPRNRVAHFAHRLGQRCSARELVAARRAEQRKRAAQRRAAAVAERFLSAGQQELFLLTPDAIEAATDEDGPVN